MEVLSNVQDNKDLYGNRHDLYKKYSAYRRWTDFRGNEESLKELFPPGSRILDYGCDGGSLGFLGTYAPLNIIVDGYDKYVFNKDIKYHDLDDITGYYDYIVFSHVLEHFTIDQIIEAVEWARVRCDNIVICLPNTKNVFSLFFDELTHIKPLDNVSFINLVNCHGYELQYIVRNDLRLISVKHWIRVFFNVLMGCDPYYNVIYVFRKAV